jgi:putative endonuclease
MDAQYTNRKMQLYVGSISYLIKGNFELKNKVIPGFTAIFNVHTLAYDEVHET